MDIATANGAIVYPYRRKGESATAVAASVDATLAADARTATEGYSLWPASLLGHRRGRSSRAALANRHGSRIHESAPDPGPVRYTASARHPGWLTPTCDINAPLTTIAPRVGNRATLRRGGGLGAWLRAGIMPA